jgi:4-hydroxybenzoate polyprenyltransferase
MTFLRLIRYKNLIMVLLTMILTKYALIEPAIFQGYLSDIDFIIFALSVLWITAGGYIINDIYDVELDQINKPQKTFVGTAISKKNAWMLYVVFSTIGLGFATYISIRKHLPNHILYYLIGVTGLYFYSRYFQKKVLIGNLIIAFICGALIYLTYSFDFRVHHEMILENSKSETITCIQQRIGIIKFYIAFSFFGTLIREIIKDIEDIDGDYNAGYQTLPIVFGIKRTRNFVIALSILFLLGLFFYTYFYYLIQNWSVTIALGSISAFTVYFLYKLWFATAKKQFRQLSTLMKLILFFGILSMILFTFAQC